MDLTAGDVYAIAVGPALGAAPDQALTDFSSWSVDSNFDSGCEVNFEVRVTGAAARFIDRFASDVFLYRNGVQIHQYRILSAVRTWNADGSASLTVNAVCYKRIWTNRILAVFAPSFTNTRQADIVLGLINAGQNETGGDYGIVAGDLGPPVTASTGQVSFGGPGSKDRVTGVGSISAIPQNVLTAIVRVAPTDWAGGGSDRVLVSQWDDSPDNTPDGSSADGRAWRVRLLASGALTVDWRRNGETTVDSRSSSIAVPNVTDGVARWLAVTIEDDVGTARFFESPDGSTWNLFASDASAAAAELAVVDPNSRTLQIGHGLSTTVVGDVIEELNGTVSDVSVLSAGDPIDPNTGAASFVLRANDIAMAVANSQTGPGARFVTDSARVVSCLGSSIALSGATGDAPSRDRTEYKIGDNIGDLLTSLAEVIDGPWWEIMYPFSLVVQPWNFKAIEASPLQVGATCDSLSDGGGEGFGNASFVDGNAELTTPVVTEARDLASDPRGRWDVTESFSSVESQQTLVEHGEGLLSQARSPAKTWTATIEPRRWLNGDGRYEPGDFVQIVDPAAEDDDPEVFAQVMSTNISVSADGAFEATVTAVEL